MSNRNITKGKKDLLDKIRGGNQQDKMTAGEVVGALITEVLGGANGRRQLEFRSSNEVSALVYPDDWSPRQVAIEAADWADMQEELVNLNFDIKCAIPTEAAIILTRLLKKTFLDQVKMKGDYSFFGGYEPPVIKKVLVGPNDWEEIYFGRLQLANFAKDEEINILLEAGDQPGLNISAIVQRHRKDKVEELLNKVKAAIEEKSIFDGLALSFDDLSWMDARHNRIKFIPEQNGPRFLNIQGIDPSQLILNSPEASAFASEVIGRITRPEAFDRANMRTGWRGILAGDFGTGKSLSIRLAMATAIANNWTVLQITKASDFIHGVKLANALKRDNGGLLMVVEDIDTIAGNTIRNEDMNVLSNLIDGTEKKFDSVILLMTTNSVSSIHPLFIRRAVVIEYDSPTVEKREAILRYYLGDSLKDGEDVAEVAQLMETPLMGFTPVIIQAIADRAMSMAIAVSGSSKNEVTVDMLKDATASFVRQHELIYEYDAVGPPTMDGVMGDHLNRAALEMSAHVLDNLTGGELSHDLLPEGYVIIEAPKK